MLKQAHCDRLVCLCAEHVRAVLRAHGSRQQLHVAAAAHLQADRPHAVDAVLLPVRQSRLWRLMDCSLTAAPLGSCHLAPYTAAALPSSHADTSTWQHVAHNAVRSTIQFLK